MTTSTQALARALLLAAEKATTPGQWEKYPSSSVFGGNAERYGVQSREGLLVADCGIASNAYSQGNAAYIALANPSNLTALVTWAMGMEEALKIAVRELEATSAEQETSDPKAFYGRVSEALFVLRSAIAGKQS